MSFFSIHYTLCRQLSHIVYKEHKYDDFANKEDNDILILIIIFKTTSWSENNTTTFRKHTNKRPHRKLINLHSFKLLIEDTQVE